jgi:hypothetical protein
MNEKQLPQNWEAIQEQGHWDYWDLLTEEEQKECESYADACYVAGEAWAEQRNECYLFGTDDFPIMQTPNKPDWMKWLDQFAHVPIDHKEQTGWGEPEPFDLF